MLLLRFVSISHLWERKNIILGMRTIYLLHPLFTTNSSGNNRLNKNIFGSKCNTSDTLLVWFIASMPYPQCRVCKLVRKYLSMIPNYKN